MDLPCLPISGALDHFLFPTVASSTRTPTSLPWAQPHSVSLSHPCPTPLVTRPGASQWLLICETLRDTAGPPQDKSRCAELKLHEGNCDHCELETKHRTLLLSSSLPLPTVSSVTFGKMMFKIQQLPLTPTDAGSETRPVLALPPPLPPASLDSSS